MDGLMVLLMYWLIWLNDVLMDFWMDVCIDGLISGLMY